MKEVSETDKLILFKIRNNVENLISDIKLEWDKEGILILEIAPQIHNGVKAIFSNARVETLDIAMDFNPTFVADLCQTNSQLIPDNSFDVIVVTEVLEHTLDPFAATREIFRMLKKGGFVYGSTPFDFRIHGPLPDCWRFTEHGLRQLFKSYKEVQIAPLENSNRFLMPWHYTFCFQKPI